MTIDQKHLSDLLAIARTGSFGRAATERKISQPALSNRISSLEHVLGAPVLMRSRTGATLTPLGSVLVRHAQALENLLARATTESQLHNAEASGSVVVGASPVAAGAIVPRAVLRMKQRYPKVSLSIIEDVDDGLIAKLRIGALDLMIATLGDDRVYPDVEEKPLLRGPMTAIMAAGNPYARRRSIRFRDLVGATWVLPNPGSSLRRRLEALFLLAHAPVPESAVVTNSIAATKALVRQSNYIAIMARSMAEPEIASGQLVAIPINEAAFTQTLAVKRWRDHELPPFAADFIKIVIEVSREIAERRPSSGGGRAKKFAKARAR